MVKKIKYLKLFNLLKLILVILFALVLATTNTLSENNVLLNKNQNDGYNNGNELNYRNNTIIESYNDIMIKINMKRSHIILDGKKYNLIPIENSDNNNIEEADMEIAGYKKMSTWEILINIIYISAAVLTSGIMSGLTVGYLSIDDWHRQINLNKEYAEGEINEKYKYEAISEVLSDRHWLLVTLLLCNATAMEALPIFLNRLVNELEAVLISVTAVLIFGEVIPQAFCCGPHQINIAYIMSKPTKFLMYITGIFSYPIARLLDIVVGEHSHKLFDSDELKVLVKLHTAEAVEKIIGEKINNRSLNPSKDDQSSTNDAGIEEKISKFIQNVIDIKKLPITKKYTPIDKVIVIDLDTPITKNLMLYYVDKGISRIPVTRNQNKNDIVGYVRTIDFLKLDPKEIFTIKDKIINIHIPLIVEPDCNVYELFTNFKYGNHMALITENKDLLERSVKIYNENLNYLLDKNKRNETKIIGIVTLEDVLEILIETDIKDESEKEKDKDQKKKLRINFKNKISDVVNDVIANSIRKTMTMKSENYIFSFNNNDDPSYNYSLLKDRNLHV